MLNERENSAALIEKYPVTLPLCRTEEDFGKVLAIKISAVIYRFTFTARILIYKELNYDKHKETCCNDGVGVRSDVGTGS